MEAFFIQTWTGTLAGEQAAMYYADMVNEADDHDGLAYLGYKSAGYLGGILASLWTPDTAFDTVFTLGTAGIGGSFNTASRASQSAAFGFRGFFVGEATFASTSRLYWGARAGGAKVANASLHHWLLPQRWAVSKGGWISDKIVNAGWNIMELPNYYGVFHRSLGLNQYMGFAMRWGPRNIFNKGLPMFHRMSHHQIKAYSLEQGIRALTIGLPIAGAATGGWLGVEIENDF